ncbi:hypothetical protein C2E21_4079 [Chlorella sorokiniana]|uniref:Peptidase M11 gametolysin domain-containing protein n=1 Tax=Chlorella sorokiniana TaxID=3076 RepID=A0A2P6TSZ7_CHLSO|nr:hypothetical protein C2E21_4079 [Chlorella sorokiniana]|eukprot:PRW57195.1 hypothetical protein C2E21_4079 [Chlorella sorokiniana]
MDLPRACLAFLALVLLAGPAVAAPTRRLLQTTLSGRVILFSADIKGQPSQRLLAVQTPSGQRVHVQASAAQLHGVASGMQVQVTGTWQQQARPTVAAAAAAAAAAPTSSSFVAASISASGAKFAAPQVTVAAAGPTIAAAKAAPTMVLSSNQLVTPDISTIFIPIAFKQASGAACAGTSLPKFSTAAVRKAVFAELNPAGPTVGGTFAKCSNQRSLLTQANSRVAEVVSLPCSGTSNGVAWATNKCDFDDFNGWSDAADAALAARGIDLSQYKYRVYLLPPTTTCAWVGLGYEGCDGSFACRAWITGDFWTSPQPIAHELGHNLYMAHAGAANADGSFDEYGDSTCVMGHCCDTRCPNTPHAWQMGWVSLQQLDGTSLKAGQTVTAVVAAQASLTAANTATRSAGLRITPSWSAGAQPIFVGYRTRAAGSGDATLPADQAGKVHLYTSAISNTYDPQPTDWKAQLAAGGSWSAAGLVVRVKAAGPTSATVTVCRRAGAETLASCQAGLDNDCNGRVGSADAACATLLAKAAAAAKAKAAAAAKAKAAAAAKAKAAAAAAAAAAAKAKAAAAAAAKAKASPAPK